VGVYHPVCLLVPRTVVPCVAEVGCTGSNLGTWLWLALFPVVPGPLVVTRLNQGTGGKKCLTDLDGEVAMVVEGVAAAWALVSGVVPHHGLIQDAEGEACPGAAITSAAQGHRHPGPTWRSLSLQVCHPRPGMRLILPG